MTKEMTTGQGDSAGHSTDPTGPPHAAPPFAGAPANRQGRPLRRRAEEKAGADNTGTRDTRSPVKARRAIHDLRVHQIELEMQNDELRRVQAELEASRARYFDLAPVGYFTLNEQGLILEANLTAASLLGVARATLVGQPLTRFILPEDQDIHCRHRTQLFETGAPQEYEIRMLRADAAPLWARVGATAARDADGAPLCRAAMSDITELKEMEKRLMAAERLSSVGMLVAGAGHELNNPLACVIGFSQMALSELRRDKPDHEELKDALEKVASHADRCRAIVGGLLAIGRGYSLPMAPVDLHEVIDGAIGLAGWQSSFTHIVLDKEYSLNLPPVFAHRSSLANVFVNVALNACQAMREGGILKVATEREGDRVRVIVQDNGVGIRPEDLHKVFDPFFSTKKVGEGNGLGLPMCVGILKSHDGDITVQSDGEGKGATVIITLPIEKRCGHEKKCR